MIAVAGEAAAGGQQQPGQRQQQQQRQRSRRGRRQPNGVGVGALFLSVVVVVLVGAAAAETVAATATATATTTEAMPPPAAEQPERQQQQQPKQQQQPEKQQQQQPQQPWSAAAAAHASRLARLPPADAARELLAAAHAAVLAAVGGLADDGAGAGAGAAGGGAGGLLSRWVAAHRPHLALEAALLAVILLVLRRDRSRPAAARGAEADDGGDALTEREVDALCREWRPEPLVPAPLLAGGGGGANGAGGGAPLLAPLPEPPSLEAWRGSHGAVVRGRDCLNLASADFLALGDCASVRGAARETVERYGVGSCGPRGFYGTFDVHLELEAALASFLGADEGIVYPYDLATLASVIPACASRADVLVLDEGCGFAIQQGALLSRARTHWFRHNDVADLARVLELADAGEGGGRGGAGGKGGAGGGGGGGNGNGGNGNGNSGDGDDAGKPKRRKMIVVEGVYANSGDAAPLRAIWELKERHRYRLCVDESNAMGVLGENGRGACEAAGLKPGRDVEVVCGTLGAALASVGGFCVGYHEVVDPQRLSGSGYCFSASLPPYLAAAAAAALGELDAPAGAAKAAAARKGARGLRAALRAAAARGLGLPACACDADEEAPLLHLQATPELMAKALEGERKARAKAAAAAGGGGGGGGGGQEDDEAAAAVGAAARRAVERALYDVQSRLISEHGVLVALPRYTPLERRLPPPSLKLHAHAGLGSEGGGGAGEGGAGGGGGAGAGESGKEQVERVARAVAEACEAVIGERFF